MFHNTLYQLSRNQKKYIRFLALGFLVMCIAWFIVEYLGGKFPLEPIVVFVGGITTLLAVYWPWKPGYADKRRKGRVTCNYMSSDHKFVIGESDLQFTLQFSKASDKSIYLYKDPSNIDMIAIAKGAGQIKEVKDVTVFDYTTRAICPEESEVVALKNIHGNYAALHIHDIRDASRDDDRDEITFSYVINPNGGTNFSE